MRICFCGLVSPLQGGSIENGLVSPLQEGSIENGLVSPLQGGYVRGHGYQVIWGKLH